MYDHETATDQRPRPSYTALTPVPTPMGDQSASPIRDGLSTAEQHLSALHEAISQITSRLETVLTPVPPSTATPAGNKGAGPARGSSHVHGRLEILNEGYLHALQRLHDLARRVEV